MAASCIFAVENVQLKRMEIASEATKIEAFDKLSVKAILKSKDRDLSSYFAKQLEYQMIVSDFHECKKNPIALRQVLSRLHMSPFFNDAYRAEFQAVWSMMSSDQTQVSCTAMISRFPEHMHQFNDVFFCRDSWEKIELNYAIECLERKLLS